MKKTKKYLALGMALIFALGTGSAVVSADAAADSGDNTLVVALTTSSFVTDYDDNYLTNYLEEKLGCELEFYMLPADAEETRTKLALMATSNEDRPDVFITDGFLTNEIILEYGSSGYFMPLDEYLADPEKMPNYNAIPEEDRKIMENTQTMADGHMYTLSSYEPETWNLTPNRIFINKAWLDKLGLSVPTTTDELKDVLIAFRDGDPNGNGVQDEIGIYGRTEGYGTDIITTIMNWFVFDPYWNFALSEDGETVITPYTTDGWREGIRYMKDLYDEGLLSGAVFTDTDEQFKAVLNQDPPIVGLTSAGSLSNWPDTINNANFLEMQLIEPLKGPEGVQYTPYAEYSATQEFSIVSGTQKLDLALKFADEFFDHDTSLIVRFGEEGVDWTRDPEQLAENTNGYVEAGLYDGLTLLVTSNVWAENQNQTWRNHGPRYASVEMGNTVFDIAQTGGEKYNPDDPTQLNAKNYELYYTKHPEHILPALKYTADEAMAIQEPATIIPDYLKQTLAEFVTGARDIETGWDAYLEELDSMGLQEWLSAAQAAYDRVK